MAQLKSLLMTGGLVLGFATLAPFALAGSKNSGSTSKAAPAPKIAAAPRGIARGMGGAGAAHLPPGAAGAHLPGKAAGAHVPGGVAGQKAAGTAANVHMPGGMGETHVPENLAGVHAPEHGPEHAPGHAPEHEGAVAGAREAVAVPRSGQPERAAEHVVDHVGEVRAQEAAAAARPRFSPPVKVVGTGVAAGAATAVAAHSFAVNRAEVTRNFGPGHDAGRDREFVRAHEHDFHDPDFHHFDERERARWRAGRWREDWRYGRWGWWYAVDDVYYPYPAPIYPYPMTVTQIVVPETTVIETPAGAAPYGGAVQGTRVAAPVSVSYVSPTGGEVIVRPLPPAPIVSYQCVPLAASYPSTRLCPATWIIVPE